MCDTGVVAVMDATCEMDIQMIKGAKKMLLAGKACLILLLKAREKFICRQ